MPVDTMPGNVSQVVDNAVQNQSVLVKDVETAGKANEGVAAAGLYSGHELAHGLGIKIKTIGEYIIYFINLPATFIYLLQHFTNLHGCMPNRIPDRAHTKILTHQHTWKTASNMDEMGQTTQNQQVGEHARMPFKSPIEPGVSWGRVAKQLLWSMSRESSRGA